MRARCSGANPFFGERPAEWFFANVTGELAGELRAVRRYGEGLDGHDFARLLVADLDGRRIQYFHRLLIHIGVARHGLIRTVGLDLEGRFASFAIIHAVADLVDVGLAGELI